MYKRGCVICTLKHHRSTLITTRNNLGHKVEIKTEKEPKIMFYLKITNIIIYKH